MTRERCAAGQSEGASGGTQHASTRCNVTDVRIGLDLESLAPVADSIAAFGDRYLRRIYTERELRECGRMPERLAECFAGKEATMKALRRGDEAIPWTDISVHRDMAGRASIALSGAASQLARARGVSSLQLSVARAGRFAVAIVVAACDPDASEPDAGEPDDSEPAGDGISRLPRSLFER